MDTVTFVIPDDLKTAFDDTFCVETQSELVAELMREAIRREQIGHSSRRNKRDAIDQIVASYKSKG